MGDDGKCSGIAETRYKLNDNNEQSGTKVVIETEGTNKLEYWSIDKVGNEEPHKTLTEIKIDATPPTTTIALSGTEGLNNWYISQVEVTLSAKDPLSGVAFTKYRIDNGEWKNYSEPFTIDSDGEHIIAFYAVDNVENQENNQTKSFKIDTQPPAVSLSKSGAEGDNGWYISDVTMDCDASDATSGVNECKVKVDDGSWQKPPVTVSDEGEHAIKFYAIDKAGNESSVQSDVIKLDKL